MVFGIGLTRVRTMSNDGKSIANVPVFVLCGGLGTRIREETEFRPKPMVPVGNRPILWHIMRTYAGFGFKNFISCLGYKAEVVKSYFLNYASMNSDFTVELKSNNLTVHSIDHDQDWQVTMADTGELTMTEGQGAWSIGARRQISGRCAGLCRHLWRRAHQRRLGG